MQFKVGDFVRNKALGTAHKCTSINGGEFEDKISTYPSLSFNSSYMREYELWQVRPGEWVWHKLLNKLVQYKGPDADDPTQHWFYCPDFSNPLYSITTCSTLDCEPFLGTLPTYISSQPKVLTTNVTFEEYCKANSITNFQKSNPFHKKLKEFFMEKGFLSAKQITAIANTKTYSGVVSESHSSWMSAWYYDDNNEKRYQHNNTIVSTSTETNRERYDREAGEKALDEARKRAYFHDYDENEY